MFPASTLPAMASAATPAIKALQAAGISYEIRQFRHDPRATSFGDEAVTELAAEGFVAAQIFKTLVLAIPGGLAVAVLPVPDKLSFKAAAAALGVPKAEMAEQAAAQRATGYVVGGISPLGQRKSLPTVVDKSALGWDRVLCSAGKRGLDIVLAPADLVAATSAVTAEICTPR